MSDLLSQTLETFVQLNKSADAEEVPVRRSSDRRLLTFFGIAAKHATDLYEAAKSNELNILDQMIKLDDEFRRFTNMDFFDVVNMYHKNEFEREKALAWAEHTPRR